MNLHFEHVHTVTKCTYYLRHVHLSVCLSVHMHKYGFHQMDFHEICIWKVLYKSAKKIQIYLKSDKISGTFHEDQSMFYCCQWKWITIKVPPVTKIVYQAVGLSVCPHPSVWLPLNRFKWNLIVGTFMKICQEITNLVKIGEKYWVLHMKT
jgi:hypothetical protein